MHRINLNLLLRCMLILVMGSSFDIHAQSFLPGYIVKNNGDTLTGFLKKRSLKAGATISIFKTSTDGAIDKFLPIEIKAYGNDSMLFESRKEYLRREKRVGNSEFYKVIFDGKLNILVGKGNKYFIGTDTGRYLTYLNRKDFLYYLTNDQLELQPYIKKMKFNEMSFINLMKVYHNSLSLTDYKIYQKKFWPANLDIWVLAGYNLTFLKSIQEGHSLKYSNSYSPTFGYRIDFYPSTRSSSMRFSINLQNIFYKELFQSQSIMGLGPAYTSQDILYEGYAIEVPLGLKFQENLSSKTKIYFMPGLSWRKAIPLEARVISDVVVADEVTTVFTDLDYYYHTNFFFFFSVGLTKNISSRNQVYVDIKTDYAGYNTYKRGSISLNVGYRIFSHKFDE